MRQKIEFEGNELVEHYPGGIAEMHIHKCEKCSKCGASMNIYREGEFGHIVVQECSKKCGVYWSTIDNGRYIYNKRNAGRMV